jgi:hypothetical protein
MSAGTPQKEVADWRTRCTRERGRPLNIDMRRTIEGPPDCRDQRRHRSSGTSSCGIGSERRSNDRPSPGPRPGDPDYTDKRHNRESNRESKGSRNEAQTTGTQIPEAPQPGQQADRQARRPQAASRPHGGPAALVRAWPASRYPLRPQAGAENPRSGARPRGRPNPIGARRAESNRVLRIERQPARDRRRRGLPRQVPVQLRHVECRRRQGRSGCGARGRAGSPRGDAAESKRELAVACLRLMTDKGRAPRARPFDEQAGRATRRPFAIIPRRTAATSQPNATRASRSRP